MDLDLNIVINHENNKVVITSSLIAMDLIIYFINSAFIWLKQNDKQNYHSVNFMVCIQNVR